MLTQLPKSHAAAREYVIYIRTKKNIKKKCSSSYLYFKKKEKKKKKKKKRKLPLSEKRNENDNDDLLYCTSIMRSEI